MCSKCTYAGTVAAMVNGLLLMQHFLYSGHANALTLCLPDDHDLHSLPSGRFLPDALDSNLMLKTIIQLVDILDPNLMLKTITQLVDRLDPNLRLKTITQLVDRLDPNLRLKTITQLVDRLDSN